MQSQAVLVPTEPKIYHIVHVDRMPSIIQDGQLWCDAMMAQRSGTGTTIGMNSIKRRRLENLTLSSRPGLRVGQCVPFYFCPRSVMLYVIRMANHQELAYSGGQGPILHLEADLRQTVAWADANNLRWAFTLSNAGSDYFEDRCNLEQLNQINWTAVFASDWREPTVKEGKQAEFLIESTFPWELVTRVGVHSTGIRNQVQQIIQPLGHRPPVEIKPDWYY